MSTVVLAALIVIASLAVVVGAVVVVLVALRRSARDRGADLRQSFPDAELGPELGQYRGGTGPFPRTRNTSWIVLTPTSVVVRPLLGSTLTLPTAEIADTRVDRSFRGHWNGRPVLVLVTALGEIGLTVDSPDRWQEALAERGARY